MTCFISCSVREYVHVLAFVMNNDFRVTFIIKTLINMNQTKAVLLRWFKGALAGAVVSMGIVTIKQPTVWAEFWPLLTQLGIAGLYGALTGLLLALNKWATWTETPPRE